MSWTEENESAAQRLLARLRQDPKHELRQEFGMFLMRHINSLTTDERKRYEELKELLKD